MYYLIAHLIKQIPEDSIITVLPLHMTLVHWFYAEIDEDELTRICKHVSEDTESFEVQVAEEAMYGLDKNIRVNKIVRDKALFELHNKLIDRLEKVDIQYTEPQWVRESWNPHVTHQKSGRLYDGDRFVVDSVDLISANSISSDRKILKKLKFRP